MWKLTELKTIDYRATKRRVISKVDRYEKSLLRVETRKHPTITQKYDVLMPSGGGGFNSKTENAGIYAAEGETEDLAYLYEFADCVKRLRSELREVFIRMYLSEQAHKDMMDGLNIGNSKLSNLKREATESFAIAMNCVVYEAV